MDNQNKDGQKKIASAALGAYVPPNNIEAEQSTLGAMLIERDAVDRAMSIVEKLDFYREAHQEIFDVVVHLASRGVAVDFITVQEELATRSKLDAIGGISYLTSLFDTVPTAANVEYYAKIVQEKSTLRKMILAAREIVAECLGDFDDIGDLTARCEQMMQDAASATLGGVEDEGFDTIGMRVRDMVEQAEMNGGNNLGLLTGIEPFDALTSGLKGGRLVMVAGPTGMGKTSFTLQIAEYVAVDAEDPGPVLFVEPEMVAEELYIRQVCSRARVDSRAYERGRLSEEQWVAINKASNDLNTRNFRAVCRPDLTVPQIASLCRRVQRRHGLKAVVVDGIALVQPVKPSGVREIDVAGIAYGLKAMAVLLNVPVIGCCQLNEGANERKSRIPQLRDLRESRAIGHASDIVLFLYSDRYYDEAESEDSESEPSSHPEEVLGILGKHRGGPRKKFRLLMDRQFTRFMKWVEPDILSNMLAGSAPTEF